MISMTVEKKQFRDPVLFVENREVVMPLTIPQKTEVGSIIDDDAHAPGQLSYNETRELQTLLGNLEAGQELSAQQRDRLSFLCRRSPMEI